LLDDFGDWDNPDSLDDNKMIAEARASVEKFKAEQQRETEQMQRYGQQLELAIDNAITIRSNKALTAGMKWKSFLELPKLPSKAPGEQEQDFNKLEQSLEELRKELDEAARKETPAEPLTLEGLFANSSFKKLSAAGKGEMIRGAQNILKADGLLLMDQPDGQPGKATHQSIAEFQLKSGLVANGELNDLTLWFMGFEGPPPASVSAEAAKTSKPTQTNKKPRIPKCPEKSIYDGFVGRTRLGKDQLFNRVNKEEYAKHLRYKAWQDKYGDLEEE
jgi:peptidoglycan hydrolase-like protein with peptidoglycan-binding domain